MACGFCHRNHLEPPEPVWLGNSLAPKLNPLECFTFLCDDRGHLLPQAKKYICKRTNHWGIPIIHAWDEDFRPTQQGCGGCGLKKKQCHREIFWQFQDMPRYYKCRGPLADCSVANCSVLDDCKVTESVDESFKKLRIRAPPVVWILGHPHATIGAQRKEFATVLADRLGYVHVDLELMLEKLAKEHLNCCPYPAQKCDKTLEYAIPKTESSTNSTSKDSTSGTSSKKDSRKNSGTNSKAPGNSEANSKAEMTSLTSSTPQASSDETSSTPETKSESPTQKNTEKCKEGLEKLKKLPPNIQRMVTLLKNVMWYKERAEAFNTCGILEMLKLAFLSYPEAEGYIVDEFPVSKTEAEAFECMFWPVAAGAYFISEKWVYSKNKNCNPKVNFPSLFIRSEEYWEKFVNQTANDFGERMLKIPFAECLNEEDLLYVESVIWDKIRRYTEKMEKCETNSCSSSSKGDGCECHCPMECQQTCSESSSQPSDCTSQQPSDSSKQSKSLKSEPRDPKKKAYGGSHSLGNICKDHFKSPYIGCTADEKSNTAKDLRKTCSDTPSPNKKELQVHFITCDNVRFGIGHFSRGLKTESKMEVTTEDVNANEDFSTISGTELEFLETFRSRVELMSEEDMGSSDDLASAASDVTVIARRAPRRTASEGVAEDMGSSDEITSVTSNVTVIARRAPRKAASESVAASVNKGTEPEVEQTFTIAVMLEKLQSGTVVQDLGMKVKPKSASHGSRATRKAVDGHTSLDSLSPRGLSQIPAQTFSSVIVTPIKNRSQLELPEIQSKLPEIQSLLPETELELPKIQPRLRVQGHAHNYQVDEPDEFPYSW